MMDLVAALFVVGLVSSQILYSNAQPSAVSVVDYGATGDGKTDSTDAFNKAWSAVCSAEGDSAKLVIPQGKQFLVKQTIFKGPCKAKNINVELGGTIVAPDSPKAWEGLDAGIWLVFEGVDGLTIDGISKGGFNGSGKRWWDQSCRYHRDLEDCTKLAPTSLKFHNCKNLTVKAMSIYQSPQTHVLFFRVDGVTVDFLNIDSPRDSPNTDGIHIQFCNGMKITNCKIKSGDDNISIGDRTNNLEISNIECGPGGHGISIGSLGKDGGQAEVRNIHVKNVSFTETTNGARIKTWQVGTGNVQNITYEDIKFDYCDRPLVIDQNYCEVRGACKEKSTGVQISDVVFKNFNGTSKLVETIQVGCSKAFPCKGVTMENIDLITTAAGKQAKAICSDCHGPEIGTVKPGPCLVA